MEAVSKTLAQRPWDRIGGGDPVPIVAPKRLHALLAEELLRLIRYHSATPPNACEVTCSGVRRFESLLAEGLALNADEESLSHLPRLRQRLLDDLAGQQGSVIVALFEGRGAEPRRQWREAVEFASLAAKRTLPAPLALVGVANHADTFDRELVFQYRGARPISPLPTLEDSRRDDQRLWQDYVHARVAWESGGDPIRASEILPGGAPATGRERQLEDALNEYARSAAADLHEWPERSILLCDWLLAVARRKAGTSAAVPPSALVDGELIWAPHEHNQYLPVPWVARAIALSCANAVSAPILRAALNPWWISAEALRMVHHREAVYRAEHFHLEETLQPGHRKLAPDGAAQHVQMFQYPPAHPIPPSDWRDHVGFGTLLDHAKDRLAFDTKSHRLLRDLRNHLAHGHPPTWELLRLLPSLP